MIIAIDFDGTLVDHRYPIIGRPVPGAFPWLRKFQKAGAVLILWTMRSDGRADGTDPLREAVEFCRSKGVEFWGVNCNRQQSSWTDSPKAYAQLYIDDAAFGVPLYRPKGFIRDAVKWKLVRPVVMKKLRLGKV